MPVVFAVGLLHAPDVVHQLWQANDTLIRAPNFPRRAPRQVAGEHSTDVLRCRRAGTTEQAEHRDDESGELRDLFDFEAIELDLEEIVKVAATGPFDIPTVKRTKLAQDPCDQG